MQVSSQKNIRTYLLLHLVIILSSTIPTLVRRIQMEAVEILFYRTLMAFVLLGIFIAIKKMDNNLPLRERLEIIASGFLVFLYWGLTFISAKISNASVCLVGMATTSLWITFLDPIFSNRARKPFQFLVGLNATLGIYIIFNSNFEYGWGLGLSIIGAFFGAILTIYNAKKSSQRSAYVITYHQMLGALIPTALSLPFFNYYLMEEGKSIALTGTVTDFLLILTLAFVISIFAYSVSIEIMKVIPPFTVALVNNLNPIYGTLAAILIFPDAELMNFGFYLGTLLLLFSVFAYPILNNYSQSYASKKNAK
ncbi:DMT family transporter [Hugenholtzia roseola]|uniref:DMT family transporter n=1 Tax=Hugenholtzia roseola TaxID=1002 RepID=UPI000406D70C|nr:DMT family transporter [Hugenholtzia roseola]